MTKSIAKDQRGAGHLAVVLVIALAVAAGAGYLVYSKQKNANDSKETSLATIASSKEVQAACQKELDDKDFCKFASNWAGTSGSYTSTLTMKTGSDTTVTVVKAENSDKNSVVTTQNGTETAAYVTLGKTFYAKDYQDGKWIKNVSDDTVVESNEDIKKQLNLDFSANTKDAPGITYKKLGKEACGSLTCFKYQIIDSLTPNAELFVWFDTDSYWLRHMSTKDDNGSFDMVLTYGKVTISTPSPTKDVPDYGSMDTQLEGSAGVDGPDAANL